MPVCTQCMRMHSCTHIHLFNNLIHELMKPEGVCFGGHGRELIACVTQRLEICLQKLARVVRLREREREKERESETGCGRGRRREREGGRGGGRARGREGEKERKRESERASERQERESDKASERERERERKKEESVHNKYNQHHKEYKCQSNDVNKKIKILRFVSRNLRMSRGR